MEKRRVKKIRNLSMKLNTNDYLKTPFNEALDEKPFPSKLMNYDFTVRLFFLHFIYNKIRNSK